MTVHVHTAKKVPESEYHADNVGAPAPTLSSSMGRKLLELPALAHYHHPRLGGGRPPTLWKDQKPWLRTGTMIHDALLGGGPTYTVAMDMDKGKKVKGDPKGRTERQRDGHDFARDWKKQAVKDARDAALKDGEFPVLHGELQRAGDMSDGLRPQLRERGIDTTTGHRESVIVWQSDTAHGPIWCRCRIDHWRPVPQRGAPTIIETADLKTARDASESACNKAVRDRGYHIQEAAYSEGLAMVHAAIAHRVDYRLAFMQLAPIPLVHVVRLDPEYVELGRLAWERAKNLWAQCLANDSWPGYPLQTTTLEAADWYSMRERERYVPD